MGCKQIIAQAYDNNKIRRRFTPAKGLSKKTDQLGLCRIRYHVPEPVKEKQIKIIPKEYV